MTRRLVLLFALALAVLTGCGAAPTATMSSSTQVLRVAFAGGQVTGDTGTVEVPLGQQVRLEVTSDVAEEAHLHGYDKLVEVPAGGTAAIEFVADIPGQFEFELHHSKARLINLKVS